MASKPLSLRLLAALASIAIVVGACNASNNATASPSSGASRGVSSWIEPRSS